MVPGAWFPAKWVGPGGWVPTKWVGPRGWAPGTLYLAAHCPAWGVGCQFHHTQCLAARKHKQWLSSHTVECTAAPMKGLPLAALFGIVATHRAAAARENSKITRLSLAKKKFIQCSLSNAARYRSIEGEKCTINCTNRRNQGLISVDRRASLLSHLQYPVLI